MKHVTVMGVSEAKWQKKVKVSQNLFVHLCPSLNDICRHRDSFWRLLQLSLSMDHNPSIWWKLATEAETVIENLTGEFSI